MSRTRPSSRLVDAALLRARTIRSATSPVTSPTITRQIAVATSGCFAIVNRSNGCVSKYVKVTAALTVAPTTAARDRLTPVTVVANTMANATITSL